MRMISALKFSSYQRKVYTLALILGLFIFVLPSCTEEVVPSQSIEIKKAGFEKFSIEDLPAMANAIAPFVNPNFEQKVDGRLTASPQNESELSKALNYDEVLARYDGKGNTNYAMAVADNDDNPFSFSNFIIMKDSSGAFRTPFVLTYEMADDFIEEYLVDKDISKFRGKITKYILGPMDAQRVVSRNPNTNDPEPGSGGSAGTPPTQDGNVVCETVSSGGSAPVPVDTGGGGGWYQVCEINLHTIYDYDMTNDGQNPVWLSWITYDNCQIVFLNQFAVAGSSTCPSGTGDGEIPVIEPTDVLLRTIAESVIENIQDPRERLEAQLNYLRQFGGEEGKAMAELINELINIQGLTTGEAYEIYAFAQMAYLNLKGQYLMSIFSVDNISIILSFGITNNLSTAARQKLQSAISRYASNTSNIALRPLGLGSTGRVIANNLTEQLVMKEIMSNPVMGSVILTGLRDTRWIGWAKLAWNNAGVEIHYVGKFVNGVLVAVDDFKFVL